MSLWIKARLIFVMGCCLFGPLLLIFGCLQIIFHGDGSFEWLVSFIASLIMTVLLTEYVFKNVFQYNILQYKLPEGHDWHMINEKKRNDGYYCKECGVKIMFDWADRKYVEAIHIQVGNTVDSRPLLFPMTLKNVRSCAEIRMDDALG